MNRNVKKFALKETVRSFQFGYLKLKFRVGARFAPRRTAGKLALLFNTPQRPQAGKLAAPPGLPQPQRETMQLAGTSVTTYVWGDVAQQPTVLMLHGWNGWGMQFAAFVPALLERGFAVVALDQVGHGASAGTLSSLPMFIDCAAAMIERLPRLAAVIGHSLGAAAAACALVQTDAAGLDLVLIAPPRGPRVFVEQFTRALGLPLHLVDGAQDWIERRYGRSFAAVGVEAVAPRLRNRTLVLHDPLDNVVPFAHGQAYVELAPAARLVALADCGHYKIFRSPQTVHAAVDFLAARQLSADGRLAQAA